MTTQPPVLSLAISFLSWAPGLPGSALLGAFPHQDIYVPMSSQRRGRQNPSLLTSVHCYSALAGGHRAPSVTHPSPTDTQRTQRTRDPSLEAPHSMGSLGSHRQ